MSSIEIIKPGLMTSIQDLGRKGLAYYAIPNSGVMDENAAKIALLLLNKNENAPLIECTSKAPHILFRLSCQIAITGADFNWTLNDQVIQRNTIIDIKKEDVLKGQFAKKGWRGYIALSQDFKLDKIYNSYSTYTNAKIGGFEGRLLKKGDVIEFEEKFEAKEAYSLVPIKKGPEYDFLTDTSKQQLISTIYKIDADSNRMGLRLQGTPLQDVVAALKNSVPVLPGFIQLPPSGLPIVVLQDGQTTGGYPRIAYIQKQFLSVLNQLPLGSKVKFKLD